MTPEKSALVVGLIGLATVLTWWVFKPRREGRDVGVELFHEDTEDEPEADEAAWREEQ